MHRLPCCRRPLFAIAIFAITLAAASTAQGDLFLLRAGGQVEGEWLNRDEQPLTSYHVRTRQGLVVQLPASDVRETVRQTPEQREYQRLAPTVANTIDGHWHMAEWCLKHGLLAQRAQHLRQIVALDEHHQQARRALGYAFINGKWVTQEAFRREEGYEYYKGRWRTAQEIEIVETQAKRELAEREWLTRLRRYRLNLQADRAKSQAAVEALRAIKDPVAVRPLAAMMGRERVRQIKMLYADVLASIDTGDAVHALVQASLQDPDEEVFYYCLEKLVKRQPPRLVDPYADALKSPVNERVNRAAVALAKIGNPSAISPLIESLITPHAKVTPSRFGADATAVSFYGDGTSMMRNEGPKVLISLVHNQQVLDTLTKLSGGSNFGYDQRAWRYWYAQEKQAEQSGQRVERRR